MLLTFLKRHSAAFNGDRRQCLHVLHSFGVEESLHVLFVSVGLLLGDTRHINVGGGGWSHHVVLRGRHGHTSTSHPSFIAWSKRFFFLVEGHFLALAALRFRTLSAFLRASLHLFQISLLSFFTCQGF